MPSTVLVYINILFCLGGFFPMTDHVIFSKELFFYISSKNLFICTLLLENLKERIHKCIIKCSEMGCPTNHSIEKGLLVLCAWTCPLNLPFNLRAQKLGMSWSIEYNPLIFSLVRWPTTVTAKYNSSRKIKLVTAKYNSSWQNTIRNNKFKLLPANYKHSRQKQKHLLQFKSKMLAARARHSWQ